MTLKKNIITVSIGIVAILLLSMTLSNSCSAVNNTNNDSKYDVVISQFNEAINRVRNDSPDKVSLEPFYVSWDNKVINSNRQVYDLEYVIANDEEGPTKYAFKDLDNDGSNELLVSNENYISNIYSIINGRPELTYLGWTKSYAKLRSNNILMEHITGGWNMGSLKANTYLTGSVNDYNNKALNVTESMSWEGVGSSFSSKNINVYYKNANGEITKQLVANNDEILKLTDEFEAKFPEEQGINWIYFDAFRNK